MGSLVNFIVPIAIPVLCLILVFILFSYVHNYSTSIKKNCQDVLKFADDLEESLADIGIFNRQNEAMIVRGEVTCKHINEGNQTDEIARKLDWYAHTRYYYFSGADRVGDNMAGSTEDWLRRQLKSKLGE